MVADRHARSDAKLKRLEAGRQATLWTWLQEDGVSMKDVVERCETELQIETSAAAVSEFRSWYFLKLRNERRENRTQQILDDLKKSDPSLSVDKLRDYGTALFMSEALGDSDSESFVRVGKMQLEGKKLDAGLDGFKAKLEQAERALSLASDKFSLVKTGLKEKISDFEKNMGSPEAPARLASLVEMINSL